VTDVIDTDFIIAPECKPKIRKPEAQRVGGGRWKVEGPKARRDKTGGEESTDP